MSLLNLADEVRDLAVAIQNQGGGATNDDLATLAHLVHHIAEECRETCERIENTIAEVREDLEKP